MKNGGLNNVCKIVELIESPRIQIHVCWPCSAVQCYTVLAINLGHFILSQMDVG